MQEERRSEVQRKLERALRMQHTARDGLEHLARKLSHITVVGLAPNLAGRAPK